MRISLITALLLLAALPVLADNSSDVLYRIDIDKVFSAVRERQGKRGLYVTVQFRVKQAADDRITTSVEKSDIEIREDGGKVAELEIYAPRGTDKLTTVLAMDTSGSMAEHNKLTEAKRAANVFLDKLHEKAESGLILFNHELLQPTERPLRDPALFAAHRQKLRERIEAARAGGGTAYLDATAEAVAMLRATEGRRAVLLMTDGVDLNSKHSLKEVIDLARDAEVPIYTLGVGEPGKNEPVTTVLVLDRSGSMNDPADDGDSVSKIKALHQAASRFVDVMRSGARTKLLPFSTKVDQRYLPMPFSNDKASLKAEIAKLKASGGTALYDATLDGIETLEAARPVGKRAVVVLTDGVDEAPGSRHRVEEVIQRARETHTPLHLLALGRPGEFNEPIMRRMAEETGGSFHHARNQKALLDIFEELSIDLHDDGIDEASLRQLADETGGKYYLARDVSKLSLIYEELAEELQSTYTATFLSRRSSHDGTKRGIDVSILRNGKPVSEAASAEYTVHGVVVPEMDPGVYLTLLAMLGCLLVIPSGVRRLYRFYGGS